MVRAVSIVALLAAFLVLAYVIAARADEPPLTIVSAADSYDVHADGSYVNLYRVELRTGSDAAARRQGQQAFSYSPRMEDLDIVEAYTRKADGRVLPVDRASIHDQLPTGTADRAMITDLREKVLLFPEVAGGDTLVYAVRRNVRHPPLPGRFLISSYLSRGAPVLDYTMTVRAPAAMALRTEAHDLVASEETHGNTRVWRWRGSVGPGADDLTALGPYDRMPRVFVSSEPDYTAFARDYAGLLQPHMRVTPRIQALADKLAAGAGDRREQARLLYDWVNANVRYVAVYLAAGALEPHDAEAVLAHGWGDCKDHAVLLQALLAARGIAAEPVMINLGNHYTLSDAPTFAQLNHLITYLPEFDLYVDSTAALAPFGTLPFAEYGKPVVHAVATGTALRHTPSLPDGLASIELRTTATLRGDGSIVGSTSTTATGPFAIELRRDAAWIQATGPGAAASQLRALGMDGSGSFAFEPPEKLAASYTISGDFTLDAQPELLEGDSFSPPAGLRLLAHAGDVLVGPLGQRGLKESEPTPCYPGREVEEVSLTLPPGRHLMRLPKDVAVSFEAASYNSTWTLQGDTVTHRAELVSRISDVLCAGSLRHQAATALEAIRHAQRTHVALSDE
jgi:hypothetical protein